MAMIMNELPRLVCGPRFFKQRREHDRHKEERRHQCDHRHALKPQHHHRTQRHVDQRVDQQQALGVDAAHQPGTEETAKHKAEHGHREQICRLLAAHLRPVLGDVVDKKRTHANLRTHIKKLGDDPGDELTVLPQAFVVVLRGLHLLLAQVGQRGAGDKDGHQQHQCGNHQIGHLQRLRGVGAVGAAEKQCATNQRAEELPQAVE